VDLVAKRDFGKMVSFSNGKITAVPLVEVMGNPRLVDVGTEYDTERYNGRSTILNHRSER
ncbi:hypothetical protein ACFLST_01975, partial [Chloroflexota bacterium]